MIHPSLYPGDSAFVLAHTRVSVFSHILAGIIGGLHLPLAWSLLAAWLFSAVLFLYACRRLALRLFRNDQVGWIAALFAAACFTLPVAGTALFIMDPYLTARSFSTPFSLLAVVAVMDRRWTRAALWITLTAVMHPQMAAYLIGFIAVYLLMDHGRRRSAVVLSIFGILACGGLWLATRHAPVTAAYREAVLSRSYFFPTFWRWYEWFGLAAPLALFAAVWRKCGAHPAAKIAAASFLLGGATCIAAFLFVHPQGPYLLARIQLLRSFQLIYALGLVLLGGAIGQTFAHRHRWVPPVLFLIAAAGMLIAARQTWSGSMHIEWPGSKPASPWSRALVWIASNTPPDAVFAVSPTLLASPAEDLSGFRARAQRSVLVDNKDEGVASIFPRVAPAWKLRSAAEQGLDQMTPAEREARLAPWHVTWLLLPSATAGSLSCPYRNAAIVVCPMRQ
ncbi:MAG TPA: DUF6798 domain-containing protein [Acidobacteriaceae bacterium]|jgi:hypothetical protein|nr:DUF6798 domain-containing protein [Acidobacteriaceae bacterium]